MSTINMAKYTINELANSKGITPLAREALLQMEAELDAIRQALAAPVQEPVGVFVEDDDIGHVRLIPHQQLKLKDGDKLYTTPPNAATPLAAPAPEERKRQSAHSAWVGLAHEEIAEIVTPYWDKYCDFDFEQFTQDIETKLKEKNT